MSAHDRLITETPQPETTPSVPTVASGERNGKHDVVTHRIVVCGLVACVLLSTLGIIAIDYTGREIPPALPAIGGTALGALTGMLAAIMKGAA
jgi:hypothetical protein